jgi:hypothetical protein
MTEGRTVHSLGIPPLFDCTGGGALLLWCCGLVWSVLARFVDHWDQ